MDASRHSPSLGGSREHACHLADSGMFQSPRLAHQLRRLHRVRTLPSSQCSTQILLDVWFKLSRALLNVLYSAPAYVSRLQAIE